MKDEFWGLSDGWHGPAGPIEPNGNQKEGFHDYIDGWHSQ